MMAPSALYRASVFTFVACRIWLVGLGGYFMFIRAPLLPEGLRYLGASAGEIEMKLPNLSRWLQTVFTVIGRFIAGCGVLVMLVSIRMVARRARGTGIALGVAGLLTVATMSRINLTLDSDFKWLLLVPALTWLVGLLTYAAGGSEQREIAETTRIYPNAPP